MMIKVQLWRDDGTLLVENLHRVDYPGEHWWAMHPAAGKIIEGNYAYAGYKLEVHGGEIKTHD